MSSLPSFPTIVRSLTFLASRRGDALNATRLFALLLFSFIAFVYADFFVVQGVNCVSTRKLFVPSGYKRHHISL